jgi:hypothetical protein
VAVAIGILELLLVATFLAVGWDAVAGVTLALALWILGLRARCHKPRSNLPGPAPPLTRYSSWTWCGLVAPRKRRPDPDPQDSGLHGAQSLNAGQTELRADP